MAGAFACSITRGSLVSSAGLSVALPAVGGIRSIMRPARTMTLRMPRAAFSSIILEDRRPALVSPADMAAPAHLNPYQPPMKAVYIVAVLVVDDNGSAAYVIAAQDQASPNVLFICDFAVEPMSRTVFASIGEKMDELVKRIGPPMAHLYLCAMTWWRKRVTRGYGRSPSRKNFDAEERLLSVAGHVSSGLVLITSEVVEQAKTSPFAGALNLRAGENVDDPLRNALVSVIALCLDNERLAA